MMMRAIGQLAVCTFIAAIWTVLFVGGMACTSIGFIGIPLAALIFFAFLIVVIHVARLVLRGER